MIRRLTKDNLRRYCRVLASRDPHLAGIIDRYGYPQLFTRPLTFNTLAFIILEQQVSLASARATYRKLTALIGCEITSESISRLTDDEMASVSVTRQKRTYLRDLNEHVKRGDIVFEKMLEMDDQAVIDQICRVKGIGKWSSDVFLMEALNRIDRFPLGDIALLNSLRALHGLPRDHPVELLSPFIEHWKPYRTVAAYLLWHQYLCERGLPSNPWASDS